MADYTVMFVSNTKQEFTLFGGTCGLLLLQSLFQSLNPLINLLEGPALPRRGIHQWSKIKSVIIWRVVLDMNCWCRHSLFVTVDVLEELVEEQIRR
jgi:hypothetical protein